MFVERMSPIAGVETVLALRTCLSPPFITLCLHQVFETLGFIVQQASALSDVTPSSAADDVYFVFPPDANVSFLDTAREMFSEFHALIAAGTFPIQLHPHNCFSVPAVLLHLTIVCRSRRAVQTRPYLRPARHPHLPRADDQRCLAPTFVPRSA